MPLSTQPVAVCKYGVPYISFIFSFLQVDLNSFPVKTVPLSVLITCGMPFSNIYCIPFVSFGNQNGFAAADI